MGVLIGNVARKERRDTAALWASNNPVPLAGEWCLETDTGNVKIGDGVLAWTVLSYVNHIVQTFDISAGNQTMTLPKITGYPQEYNFFWTGGDGTFTATLAVTNAETVGGIVAATWTGEGEGSISCVSNGTNWEVKAYSDGGTGWLKNKDGSIVISGQKSEISAGITTAFGAIFRSNVFTGNYSTFCPVTLIGIPIVTVLSENPPVWNTGGGTDSSTQFSYMFFYASSLTVTVPVNFTAFGRWRT